MFCFNFAVPTVPPDRHCPAGRSESRIGLFGDVISDLEPVNTSCLAGEPSRVGFEAEECEAFPAAVRYFSRLMCAESGFLRKGRG